MAVVLFIKVLLVIMRLVSSSVRIKCKIVVVSGEAFLHEILPGFKPTSELLTAIARVKNIITAQ